MWIGANLTSAKSCKPTFSGTLNLIDIAHSNGLHVTNFATGCIYSYDAEHRRGAGFKETDTANFRGRTTQTQSYG